MTTHTEAAEQYIKNRLGDLVEVDLDAKFDEVNINDEKYKLLKDDDGAGIFDRNGRLFRNNNGDVKLTTGILPPLIRPENTIENSVDLYDFSKPNQENAESFTEAGRRFYTRQMDENATEEDKTARLIEIEKQLNNALIEDQKSRDKTEKNGSNVPLIIKDSEKLEEEGEGNGALSNATLQKAIDKYQGLHSTDYFLQRLSLKNLKYPVDADYGNTQDYIQINQFTYKPPNPDILFGEDLEGVSDDEVADKIFERPRNIILEGLKSQSPKEKHIGLVKLPMPNDLKDSNNVAWGQDQLNAITAAAANLTSSGLDQGIKLLKEIQSKDKNLFEGIGQVFGAGGQVFGQVLQTLEKAQENPNATLLGRSVVGAGILNFAGFGLSPEAILARGAGIIPNSNLQLLFNAPTLRSFRFNWKMSPRSRDEAIRINNILRFFKQGMAVKKQKGTSAGGASYFLATPNVFDISFRTSKTNRGITNLNNSVLKMKTCACTGVAVNYAPQGMWNAYEEGQPTSCILSLEFKELEPIYNTDYDEDPFKYEDLTGFVPENAVGY